MVFRNWSRIWADYHDYLNDNIYNEHLIYLKKNNIDIYSYSEIPDTVKLITLGIFDQYAHYKFFTFSKCKLHIDYEIILYYCSLVNGNYHIVNTYNIIRHDIDNDFQVISINQDDPDRIDYVWFFDIKNNILTDIFDCNVYQCYFNDNIDWNHLIMPSQLLYPYIIFNDTVLTEQFKMFIESARFLYGV